MAKIHVCFHCKQKIAVEIGGLNYCPNCGSKWKDFVADFFPNAEVYRSWGFDIGTIRALETAGVTPEQVPEMTEQQLLAISGINRNRVKTVLYLRRPLSEAPEEEELLPDIPPDILDKVLELAPDEGVEPSWWWDNWKLPNRVAFSLQRASISPRGALTMTERDFMEIRNLSEGGIRIIFVQRLKWAREQSSKISQSD